MLDGAQLPSRTVRRLLADGQRGMWVGTNAGLVHVEVDGSHAQAIPAADGKPAEMGPTEYRLLQFFMTHQERAYTRSQLLDQVWGGNVYVEERTVDVHIRRLRKALGDVYENLVQTVRGTGYRFSTKG